MKKRKKKRDEEGTLVRTAEWAGTAAGNATRQVVKGLKAAASTMGLAKDTSPGRKTTRPRARKASGNGRRSRATKK